jgi:drug/metabolite transporter (DMT)-like permease
MFRSPILPAAQPGSGQRSLADVAALAASVAGMAVAAPLIKDIAGADPLAIALWRNLISVIVVAPALLWRHRSRPPQLPWQDLIATITAGGLFALYLGLWIPSLRLTGVAASTGLSFAVAPLWVMVIRRLQGEPLPGRAWAGTLLAVTGVLALTGFDLTLSLRHLLGDLMALASGIAVAGYLVIGARTRQRVDTTTYTTLCYGSAATALALACLVTTTPASGYPPADWAKITLLTLSVQLVGHSLNARAVKTLGIGLTSTAILLETPGATLIEGLWHRAWPAPAVLFAVLVVLAGLILVVRATAASQLAPPPAAARASGRPSQREARRTLRSAGQWLPRQRPAPAAYQPRYGAALAAAAVTLTAVTALRRRNRHPAATVPAPRKPD